LWSLAGLWATEIQAQLWGPKTGGVVYEISPNGRYVSGLTLSAGGNGFVWDTQSDVFETLGQGVYPYDVTDDKLLVGNFNDAINGIALLSGGYREPGASEWSSLGAGLISEPGTSNGSSAQQITLDRRAIVGSSRKRMADGYFATVPYCWSKSDAGEWTGAEWAHPDDIKQGTIIDISDDGKTAVGYIHPGTNRVAILWKSPGKHELPFPLDAYSEYLCISANGKYAGFSYNNGPDDALAGIHNMETGEITFIPEGVRVNAVDNKGFAFGVYRPNGIDRAFIRDKKLGFMDFGDFVTAYASEAELELLELSSSLWRALTNKAVTFSINAVTPDGWTFALCLQLGGSGEVYVLKIAPVTIYHFPQNLKANVPPADRNKVILNWEAPMSDGKTPTEYAIYRRGQRVGTVDEKTLTYTDENVSPPGYYNYQVTAVHGNKQSNFSNIAQAVIVNSYDLPLRENFDKLNLTANYWTAEINREPASMEWHVYDNVGVGDGTGLTFSINNLVNFPDKEFSASLTSKYLDGRNASNIFLSFLVKPDYYPETTLTPDTLLIDVYDGSEWKTVDKYVFRLSMEWKADILDLSETAAGKLFRVRFRITGANHTVSVKHIHFDDIVIATAPPAGNAVPLHLAGKTSETDTIRLVWQNPQTNLYALTYANSSKHFSAGNEGVSFIAANRFNADELSINAGLYLTSISAYINRNVQNTDTATVLKAVVFSDGKRIVDQPVSNFVPNAWNTFYLDTPVLFAGKNFVFGLEVVSHASKEEPIGFDGGRRPVSGSIYSEDGGKTWKTLIDAKKLNNWCIIGNLSSLENTEVKPSDIVGYNVYCNGVKLNDDLIFGQSFTANSPGDYMVRAYSLASGISEKSNTWRSTGDGIQPVSATGNVRIYPNPVKDILYVRSEMPVESLTVYDLSGRVCKQAGAGATTLSMKDLNSGLYLVKIKTAAGESTLKIVVSGDTLSGT
jgi:hypothetical protein